MDILQTLVKKGIVEKGGVAKIENEIESLGISLEEALIKRGVSLSAILEAKGEYFDIPTKNLEGVDITGKVLDYIPEDSAMHYRFVPIGITDGTLFVGMVDPDDMEAHDALNFISSKLGMPFKIFVITETDFAKVSTLYKGLSGEVSRSLSELETEIKLESEGKDGEELLSESAKPENGEHEKQLAEDAPVTKIVATLLRYATDGNASDIHIEPGRESVKVRFRVDGVMNTSLILPLKVHLAVIARIKILSNMRLDEKRKPQDGRFTAKIEGRRIDFRVSTFPTYFGEKVVMRLLDKEKGVKKLDDIGMSKRNLELVKAAIKKPYGLILISGPTGSGKTTTLYSMLNEVDREHQNVLSLEDPIEYNIEGMSQSQVKPEIGYTFASGLRTTLRQDPDVIMVGEIRDKETAQLAIQAALTGHLVFSTIHTNSATGVIPRLIDMGVDPFLIAPTLILAMAQRLTLGLCPGAGTPLPVEGSLKLMIDKQFSDLPQKYIDEIEFTDKVYKASITADCPNGTRGRVAVIEVMEMDKDLEAIILKNPTEANITKAARNKGMLTMKEDAIIKAMHQLVPFEEVNTL
ncbi:MAG: type II secretion system protein E [Parcubacteria group bacterium GW2011_GWA2_40_14]|nr:MAG: type II secretion system protein E [Parcubacteria group bacterium GW2011_GWA2_40_14]